MVYSDKKKKIFFDNINTEISQVQIWEIRFQINIESSVKSQRGRDGGHDLTNQPVEDR